MQMVGYRGLVFSFHPKVPVEYIEKEISEYCRIVFDKQHGITFCDLSKIVKEFRKGYADAERLNYCISDFVGFGFDSAERFDMVKKLFNNLVD